MGRIARRMSLCLVALACVAPVRAEGLADAIPANAEAVVIVNNFKTLEKGLQNLARGVGYADVADQIDVEMVASLVGLTGLIDWEKGLAVVVTDTLAAQDAIAILLPVSNAKEVLTTLGGQAAGDLYNLDIQGQAIVALPKDKTIILAMNADALAPVKNVTKSIESVWTAEQKKIKASTDLFLSVNVAALRPILEQGLSIAKEAGPMLEGQAAELGPQGEQGIKMLLEALPAIENVVLQTDYISGGLKLTDSGLGGVLSVGFSADGDIRKIAAGATAPSNPLLANLPAQPFFLAISADCSKMQGMEHISEAIYKATIDASSLPADVKKKGYDASVGLAKETKSFSTILSHGKDGLQIAGQYAVTDPKKFAALMTDVATLNQLMGAYGSAPGKYTAEGKKSVDGKEVTQMSVDFDGVPDEAKGVIAKVFGEKPVYQVGTSSSTIDYAFGSNDPIKAFGTSNKLVAEKAVKTTVDLLPKESLMVALVDIFQIASVAKEAATEFGADVPPIELPSTAVSPIGVALTATSEGFVGHLAIPYSTLGELVKVGSALQN